MMSGSKADSNDNWRNVRAPPYLFADCLKSELCSVQRSKLFIFVRFSEEHTVKELPDVFAGQRHVDGNACFSYSPRGDIVCSANCVSRNYKNGSQGHL